MCVEDKDMLNGDFVTEEGSTHLVQANIKSGYIKNVAIFIDYDNIYYSMRNYGININEDEYNICRLLNNIYPTNVVRKFRAYADFQQIDANLTKLQELRVQIRHVYGNSKDEKYRKNASDIELSLDAMETYYKNPNIDTFVFLTCDSDMIPIMSRLKYKGKQVHLYYMGENISHTQHINTYADVAFDLIKIFKIDTERAKPQFWFESVCNILESWHNNSRNQNKFYSGAWLKDDIINECYLTASFAADIIQVMRDNKIIDTVEVEGKTSFVLAKQKE